jgi:IS5 family transposase
LTRAASIDSFLSRAGPADARHGLDRCRYKGFAGMNRWVGLGVIADNVVNIGRAIEKQAAT